MASDEAAELEVQLKFFPLAFLFLFCTPVVEIDGEKHRRPWGTHRFAIAPGPHRVRIYFPYLFWPECGANSIDLDLGAGESRRIRFYMPPLVFLKGSLSEV